MLADFQCRSCESRNGDLVLDLGEQPLANNILAPEDLAKPEPRFPLRLAVCTDCWLLQITDLVPPVELFSDYVYFSSYSETWVAHTAACADRYLREFAPKHVVEIASNDGCLLRHFAKAGVSHLGIEPAENVAAVARENGVTTHSQFFSERVAKGLAEKKRADLILANNVFAHAPDINDFVAGLCQLLTADGCAILEFPHALEMFAQGEFDTIYHEHVFYFTLTALQPLMARHSLRAAAACWVLIQLLMARLAEDVKPSASSSAVSTASRSATHAAEPALGSRGSAWRGASFTAGALRKSLACTPQPLLVRFISRRFCIDFGYPETRFCRFRKRVFVESNI